MNEMIERVGKAIWDAMEGDPDFWDERDIAPKLARAAIAAMREPSEAMKAAAAEEDRLSWSLEPGEGRDSNPAADGDVWRAMIDAALEE